MSVMASAAGVLGQQTGGGGPTVYAAHDFTNDTTGDLDSNRTLDTDELGNGWSGAATSLDDLEYQSDSSGVTSTINATRYAAVETDGRENVRVILDCIPDSTAAQNRHLGVGLRGTSNNVFNNHVVAFFWSVTSGVFTDLDLRLQDGGSVLKTWDLSALATTVAVDDEVIITIDCDGDDITLVSIDVNGTNYDVNDTVTLTGASQTAHGAGSGADWYGIYSNARHNNGHRFRSLTVQSLPA